MQALRRKLGIQSSAEFHDHGLHLLVPDLNDAEELQARRSLDIVFVHGLTGTWDGTWTGETSDGQKVLWPRDLLKERFPTARIFSFSYDANAVNLAHRVSTQSITQHANDLLIELETVRRETGPQEYKIVFAVHSLGGLVVQKMLSLSKNHYEAHCQRIESHTIGAAFFGTPMLGADLAAWASIGTALSSVLKQTNRDIVGVLEPNSTMAESIRLDITNLVARRAYTGNPIKIACFYECLPVPGYGRVVVSDKSATWPPHYQKGIQADHMNMTKFASTQARGYRDFIGEVGRWVDEDTAQKSQLSDTLNRLDFAESTARQQQIDNTDALESTLDWVWSEDHESHSSFAQWLIGDQPVFWIQGKPGSGKSTLISYVEKASRSWQLHSESDSPWSTIRFFFDFRAHGGLANNLEGFLRSLLFQILKQVPSSENELRRLEAQFSNHKADKWASSALKGAFVDALLQTSMNLCILVDGLDEFSGNMLELLTFFHKLPSRTNTGHLLKICLASRPHAVIALALGDRPGLKMQAHNTNAIKQYAFITMASLGVAAHDRAWLENLSADIAEKAEGVFLWARFAVKEVINGYAEGENINELDQRLEALPSDMDELYTNIFSRMDPRDHGEARIMFQLVCFAQRFDQVRFINLRQLKEAVAIAQNNVGAPAQRVSVDELKMFRKRLKAKSGGLLEEVFYETGFEALYHSSKAYLRPEINPSKRAREHFQKNGGKINPSKRAREHFQKNGGMITLIHRTAESYLDRGGWFLGLKFPQFTSPHAMWLHVCCESIQSKSNPYEWQLPRLAPAILKIDESSKSSLFEYASHNLFVHARLLESNYKQSSFPFLQTIPSLLWRYLRKQYRLDLENQFEDWEFGLDWDAVDKGSDRQPWQIIVEQGLPLCLRDAALEQYYTPPTEGEDMSLVLLHTKWLLRIQRSDIKEGNFLGQLVSCLVELGAVVRQRHIIECLYSGQADVLGALLASWPRGKIRLKRDTLYMKNYLDLRDDEFEEEYTYDGETIGVLWELVRASHRNEDYSEAMLCLLLERGESINELCGPGGTALHGCMIGDLDEYREPVRMVEMLLRHGADPNISGPRGTPLQLAWRTLHSVSFVKDLEDIGSPDQFQEVMRLLLKYGADPNWVEPNGLTIDRPTIEIWCAMSLEEMDRRWEDDDYPYCISSWYNYEFPLYRPKFRRIKSQEA